jgi:hypothetical protein
MSIAMVLAANVVVSLIYVLVGMWLCGRKKSEADVSGGRRRYILLLVFFLVCPVVGVISHGLGNLFRLLFFRKKADLSDVVFSKDRAQTYEFVDMERERNMASFEEAIAVSDNQSLRGLMLNVLKGDVKQSLNSIALGLNSQDSETSHYAAAALRDELGDFRNQAQSLYREIQEGGDDCARLCRKELEYMETVLRQRVLTDMEQTSFVTMFADVGERLYGLEPESMRTEYYQWIIECLVDNGQYALVRSWCERAIAQHPDYLFPYKSLIKTCYEEKDRDGFFAQLERLKNSSVVLENDTLEMIRTFGMN